MNHAPSGNLQSMSVVLVGMRRTIAVLVLLAAAVACDTSDSTQSTAAGATSTGQTAAEAWVAPNRYSYKLTSSCGERSLIGEFRIAVEDGGVLSVKPLDESARAMVKSGFESEVPSIEDLVAEAAQAEADGADLVQITRAQDGRPTLIEIDYRETAIDDEACYAIGQFEDLS